MQLLGNESFGVGRFPRSYGSSFRNSEQRSLPESLRAVVPNYLSRAQKCIPTAALSRTTRLGTDAIAPGWSASLQHNTMHSDPRVMEANEHKLPTSREVVGSAKRNSTSDIASERSPGRTFVRDRTPETGRNIVRRGRRTPHPARDISAVRAATLGPAIVLLRGNDRERRRFMTELHAGNAKLSIEQFNEILSAMLRMRRVRDAAAFTQLWDREPWLSILRKDKATKSYTIMIDAYGKCNQLARAFTLFYTMTRVGPKPNVVTFNAMIAACARNNEPNMAYEVFEEMQASRIAPDKFTFGSLIDACAKSGQVERAFEVSRLMDQSGVVKDQTIYSALMDACGRAKQLDRALLLYEEMKRNAVWPNLVTFAVLIDTCANARRPDRAFQLFSEIKHWGFPRANVVVYTALIDACSKAGWPERAERVMANMVANGIRPNEISFGALMDGWTKGGQINRAFEIIERMVNVHDVLPNAVLVGGLIDASRRLNEPGRAKPIWSVVMKYNIRPSRTYYPPLIAMAARSGDLDVASAITLHAYARGSLRRVALNSENPTLYAMACAIAYLLHSIRTDTKSSQEVKKQHLNRLRVVFNSTAMRPDQLTRLSPEAAYQCCTSWNHTDSRQTRTERRYNGSPRERSPAMRRTVGKFTGRGQQRTNAMRKQNRSEVDRTTMG